MKPPRKPFSKRLGSALVMTLVIVVLITVVTVGYLASVMLESKTAGAGLDQERAYGIAVIGVHEAMSRVRDALGLWDDPYKNFAASNPPFYWSLSPGRITRWSYSSVDPLTNFALFSESTGTNLVNLNRALSDGSYPIIGGTNPPDVSVKWANVLREPTKPASATNAIVGRYAFWVDDESAKINVNTADGTEKYTANSLGVGSPSEVSLEVLFGGTNGKALSKELVQIARTNGFSSPREVLRGTNISANIYTSNVFSLTTYSRSPDLNVFGEPKMALVPILGDAWRDATNMVTNGITMRALSEIYPTPSQLPKYVFTIPMTGVVPTVSWPLAFRQDYALLANGRHADYDQTWLYTVNNYGYANGMMLAKYLSGTNAAGRAVTWPLFRDSSALGFAGKYTARQIDSIAAQICSLGNRAISPDYPYVSDSSGWLLAWYMETKTDRSSAPIIFPGFTTNQWVIGMGRSPKVSRLLLKFTTYAAAGTLGQTNYIPPKASMDAWLEWWLPAAFRGGTDFGPGTGREILVGHRENFVLNCADGVRSLDITQYPALPKLPAILPSESYWSDQLLRNNYGIDFRGNPPDRDDPDQTLAQQYHHPYALNTNGTYIGTGPNSGQLPASPFQMADLESPNREWYAGEIRCVRNVFGGDAGVRLPMSTNADTAGASLQILGGIAVRAQMRPGWVSDPDPVPFEAVRGTYTNAIGETKAMGLWTCEDYGAIANSPDAPSETVRDRAVKSVIPITANIPVPANGSTQVGEQYVLATVKDPLVNKFPGDWDVAAVSGAPATMQTNAATTVQFGSYDEDDAWRVPLTDPDSYWMPQIDSLRYAGQASLIPRSARFPNIGYLQYVRTGIIPDDEVSVPYIQQKGTPFRLLSYAPSTEQTSQRTTRPGSQAYPDWALLDLLYVPATLAPFGGSYGNSTNLLFYGTYGGATAGRINPNGSVIYTTDVNVPQTNVSRTLPMQAMFDGIRVNEQIIGAGTNVKWTNGTTVDPVALAQAVQNYVRTNGSGALRMPAEICNVPEIAALRPGPTTNLTRNDLVRQIVGNLTTQGNVFSVWTTGQAIQKNKKNSNYSEFESGDTVLAEVRLHFLVERYLDPGADGIYGNGGSGGAGVDGTVGTYDDPADSVNHPPQPRYLYRVVSSEEIR
jgi:hypothetical protein